MNIKVLDPYSQITFSKNRLPHWQQTEATYFITFRLADSIPRTRLFEWTEERKTWLRSNPPPWTAEKGAQYLRRFPARLERWLDDLEGSCVLRQQRAQRVLAQ